MTGFLSTKFNTPFYEWWSHMNARVLTLKFRTPTYDEAMEYYLSGQTATIAATDFASIVDQSSFTMD